MSSIESTCVIWSRNSCFFSFSFISICVGEIWNFMHKDGEMGFCSDVSHKYRFEHNKRYQSFYTYVRKILNSFVKVVTAGLMKGPQ